MSRSNNIRINIYMAKDKVPLDQCLKDLTKFKKYEQVFEEEVKFKNGNGKLIIGKGSAKEPSWIKMLENIVIDKAGFAKVKCKNSSLSSILCFKVEGSTRVFLMTFGHGGKYIKLNKIEKKFGRNVVLNTANPEKFHSLRTRSYDGKPWLKEHQSATPSNILQFELNTNYELLSRVTAEASEDIPTKYFDPEKKTKDNLLSPKMTGYESLSLNSKLDFNDLAEFCNWLEITFNKTRYKELVKDIDNFDSITDEVEIEDRYKDLLKAINNSTFELIHVSPPEMIDYDKLEGFKIEPSYLSDEEVNNEFDPSDILNKYKISNSIKDLTLDNLKEIQIHHIEDGITKNTWDLLDCLVFESKKGSLTYALFNCDWFVVKKKYYDFLENELNAVLKINSDNVSFINHVHANEDAFNRDQCRMPGFNLLDKKCYMAGGHNKIEIADILHDNKNYVHAKRYGDSSGLSHLSYQAINSTEMLLSYPDEITTHISNEGFAHADIGRNIKERDFLVTLLILHEKSSFNNVNLANNFSLFSLVTLHKTFMEIKRKIGHNRFEIILLSKNAPLTTGTARTPARIAKKVSKVVRKISKKVVA